MFSTPLLFDSLLSFAYGNKSLQYLSFQMFPIFMFAIVFLAILVDCFVQRDYGNGKGVE